MQPFNLEAFLWCLFALVLFYVVLLAGLDPTLRPVALDVCKFALGGILTAITATATVKR